jgi:hypothetical protein
MFKAERKEEGHESHSQDKDNGVEEGPDKVAGSRGSILGGKHKKVCWWGARLRGSGCTPGG